MTITLRDHIYRTLDIPAVYRLAQTILAPGTDSFLTRAYRNLAVRGDGRPWLDVGCGPHSYVPRPASGLYAVDLNPGYVAALDGNDCAAAVSDAASLPFADGRFGAVWTTGLLHHLPDDAARQAVAEMIRVCDPAGQAIVCDAVLPRRWWTRPQAHIIRRLDRGRHMRTEQALRILLPDSADWQIARHTYTLTGLELLLCIGRRRR